MSIAQEVGALGGVVRSSELRLRGWSDHSIRAALSSRHLVRPRKGWIALPSADPKLLFAAKHGLMLSCITEAARLTLWVRDAALPHFAVPRAGAEIRPAAGVLHWMRPLLPRRPYALSDPIENVLDHVAHCQPHEDAVATWDSALNKRLIDVERLRALPLRSASRTVLADCSPLADSGLESYVRVRLAWLTTRVIAQAWVHGRRVDFLIGERLILQIDGGHHVGHQRTQDIRHDAELALRGYTVIRIGYAQVVHDWPEVQDRIVRAIAAGLHRRRT